LFGMKGSENTQESKYQETEEEIYDQEMLEE
jgi:hypothetical protein